MKIKSIIFSAFVLAVCLCSGCSGGKYISEDDLTGMWYATISAENTIKFDTETGMYQAENFFMSGKYTLQRSSNTIQLTDIYGDTQTLIAERNEEGDWALHYESPYFPLTFTQTPPEDAESLSGTGAYEDYEVIGKSILEILNAGEWHCNIGSDKLLFNSNQFSLDGRTYLAFEFASVEILDTEYHFTATYQDGTMVGRISTSFSDGNISPQPDIYTLDLMLNGEQYIRATLNLNYQQ